MKARIWTVPNQITFLRLGFLPLFLILVLYEEYRWSLLVLFVAGFSDGIDGLLARTLHQKSALGAYLDPIADKLLLSSSFIVLSLEKKIFWWLTIMVISRDILMLTVPFEGQASLLKELKPAMHPGSILIDATVPLAAGVGKRSSGTTR